MLRAAPLALVTLALLAVLAPEVLAQAGGGSSGFSGGGGGGGCGGGGSFGGGGSGSGGGSIWTFVIFIAPRMLYREPREAWSSRDVAALQSRLSPDLLVEWRRRLEDFERKGWVGVLVAVDRLAGACLHDAVERR